jgi:hypothetical protein
MKFGFNWLHYIGLVIILIGVILFFTVFLGPFGLATAIAGWIVFIIGYLWPAKTPKETAKKTNHNTS